MKITKILKSIIYEDSRFNVIYNKVVMPEKSKEGEAKKPKGLMDFKTLKTIIFADPTTKAPEGFDIDGASIVDMEKVKVGKYTQWLIKNFLKPVISQEVEPNSSEYRQLVKNHEDLFLEDINKLKRDLQKYDKFKNSFDTEKRDINKLTINDLFELVKDLKLEKTKASKKEKEEAVTTYEYPGSTVDFRGPNWTVVKIEDTGSLGKNAACFFGGYQDYDAGESNWCTSAPGLNYFNNYIKQGPLYVILPNQSGGKIGSKTKLPIERYQFHFQSSQFMDREDRQIDLVKYLNNDLQELKEYFKKEFAKGIIKSKSDIVDIEYPRSSESKFVAIYGFNELFDSLPTTIVNFSFKNNSKEKIAYDIPEKLGNFKNLETIRLVNCVKTLPSSIKELKKLDMLNLTNNPELKSLPEKSLFELVNLTFINIKDCDNLKMSDEFMDKLGNEISSGLYYVDF
jgi:hypothetical protein